MNTNQQAGKSASQPVGGATGQQVTKTAKKDLARLYDHLFTSLELLKDSPVTSLDMNVKRAAAVRQTAAVIIDAAKLEFQAIKLKRTSSLDGLFPNLDGMKQLGAGETEAEKKKV